MGDRVLIIDPVHDILVSGLTEHGFGVYYQPDISASDVKNAIFDLEISGLIVRSKMSFSGEFFQGLTTLKWLARAGVGLDNVDGTAAAQAGVHLLNAEGANAQSVAEHVLGMMLGFNHRLFDANHEVKRGQWDREKHRGRELSSMTVGIIGVGNTGGALARLLQGFSIPILGYDKYKTGFGQGNLEEVSSLDRLFEEADILSFHIPLNEETVGFVDAPFLSKLKKRPLIINAARGGIMDVVALEKALNDGRISGLLLDVWPVEPPLNDSGVARDIFERWASSHKVIFSPHVAGWSFESYEHISRRLLDNILKFS